MQTMTQLGLDLTARAFSGPAYTPETDNPRLSRQFTRVFQLMEDGLWRTLREIADETGAPEASVSAQLRHMRKPRFGGHQVNKRHRGPADHGLYEYQLQVNVGTIALGDLV